MAVFLQEAGLSGEGAEAGGKKGCYFRRHSLGNTCEFFLFLFCKVKAGL